MNTGMFKLIYDIIQKMDNYGLSKELKELVRKGEYNTRDLGTPSDDEKTGEEDYHNDDDY